mmetsp:Transcript_44134/g.79227  ORF Transcript_44134/g.79227 Transcript_44134/m.79227 type:complete len:243 (+) Transcript_44134:270-998(+)
MDRRPPPGCTAPHAAHYSTVGVPRATAHRILRPSLHGGRGRQHFVRVEDDVGVQQGLQLPHQLEAGRGLAHVQDCPLLLPDPVLGTDAALVAMGPLVDKRFNQVLQLWAGPTGVRDVHVHVAVPEVPEAVGAHTSLPGCSQPVPHRLHEGIHPRDGEADVVLVRMPPLGHRRRDPLAQGPDGLGLRPRLGHRASVHAALAQHRLQEEVQLLLVVVLVRAPGLHDDVEWGVTGDGKPAGGVHL